MKTIKVKNITYRDSYSIVYRFSTKPDFTYILDPNAIFFGDRCNDILRRENKPNLAYKDYCFKVLE